MKHFSYGCVAILTLAMLGTGCLSIKTQHEIKPIEIKPIHITMDINLKVDKELNNFFGDIDEAK